MTYTYSLCGWRVNSRLTIPELVPDAHAARDTTSPTLTVREGETPEDLEDLVGLNAFIRVNRSGAILVRFEDVRFLVTGGNDVIVQFLSKDGPSTWSGIFLGTVIQCLCHQRGWFPLHAASLLVGNRCIAIAGHSGDGKSTLALELVRRGHRLLSDDLTVLRTPETRVEVLPAFPRLRLWRETLEAHGIDYGALCRISPGREKYNLDPEPVFARVPLPLDQIFVIAAADNLGLRRLRPVEGIPALSAYVCRPRVARALGRDADLLALVSQVSVRTPIHMLGRPKLFDHLPRTAEMIEDICR